MVSDVYLSLNGVVIPNNGYVVISDIDDTALLCHTNSVFPVGDWFAPDGSRVFGTDVPGITSKRGSMVLRLRRTSANPPEGIYHCFIADDAYTFQSVYVGLYSSGRGKKSSICLFALLRH